MELNFIQIWLEDIAIANISGAIDVHYLACN